MNRIPRPIWVVVALVVCAAAVLARSLTAGDVRGASVARDKAQQFVGVAGCSAVACHGGTRSGERTEYMTWIQHDRHARAYSLLFEEKSQPIARNLGISQPETDKRCLVCHSTAVDSPRGPRFAKEDGVGCEACHGPAERWLVPHSRPDWKEKTAAEKYGSSGMTNTKDVVVRASLCVSCHVGAPGQDVNHDLIAVGHPLLLFELDAFTAIMPPHWRETPDKSATFGAQAWAVGQAVSLKQSLELLAHRAKRGPWPEFAAFECYACHHDLKESSWRQQLGYGDRRPGTAVWSSPPWLITQRLTAWTGKPAPGADEFDALRALLIRSNSRATDVATAAEKALSTTTQIVQQVSLESWDSNRLRRLLTELATEPRAGSLDYASVANLTMALGAVFKAIVRGDSTAAGGSPSDWSKRVGPVIDRLYSDVDRPAEFSAPKFLQDLKSLRGVVLE